MPGGGRIWQQQGRAATALPSAPSLRPSRGRPTRLPPEGAHGMAIPAADGRPKR
jgi:hypothetical protein